MECAFCGVGGLSSGRYNMNVNPSQARIFRYDTVLTRDLPMDSELSPKRPARWRPGEVSDERNRDFSPIDSFGDVTNTYPFIDLRCL